MKKKKLKLMNIKEDQELSRFDMKSIMAGCGGSCVGYGEACNTPTINCCSGFVCADHVCQHPTLT